MPIRALWRSHAVRAAAVFGFSGAGFVLANLILARALPAAEYAVITLVVAIAHIAMFLGPLGMDSIIVRRSLPASRDVAGRVLVTSAACAAATVGIGTWYALDAIALATLGAAVLAGGMIVAGSAVHQGQQRFGPALALSQSPNAVLFGAAIATLGGGAQGSDTPLIVFAAGLGVIAIVGWHRLLVGAREPPHESAVSWPEVLALVSVGLAGLILMQIERLVIPQVLSLGDLATFAVLAAVAGSPFRVVQMGMAFTLMPRLRAAPTAAERRRIVGRECLVAVALVGVAAVVVVLIAPPLVHVLLGGRYGFPPALLAAIVVTGVLRVANAVSEASLRALANTRELGRFNGAAWAAVVTASVGAVTGSRWGLTGVVYGSALGWLVFAGAGAVLAAPHFRQAVAGRSTEDREAGRSPLGA